MVKKYEKQKKIALVLSIVLLLSLIILLFGKSFSFFNYRKEGETVNVVTFKGLVVNIINSSNNSLNLTNAYPMYDSEGMEQDSLDFTITNHSTKVLDYTLKVENDTDKQNTCYISGNTICPQLSTNYIKYSYKIDDGSWSTPSNLGDDNNIVFSDAILSNDSVNVSLKIWIDSTAGNEIQGKYFYGKLVLEASKSNIKPSYAVTMAGSNIAFSSSDLNIAYGKSSEVTITPSIGSYISSGSCTNGYTITNLTTGITATQAQTITINSNKHALDSICTITTTTSGYDVALEGTNITFGANTVNVSYGSTSTVTVTPDSGYYISSASCTNNYTITNLDTTQSATETQTITINNNNQIQGSTCTFTTVREAQSFATDSWETIVENVRNGNVSVYAPTSNGVNNQVLREVNLGSLGTHYLRVANTTACTSSQTSTTGCGFVIEFADIITTHNMNSSSTNVGGYPASSMFTYINNTILPAMPQEIRNIMIPTTVVSSHGSSDSNNFTTTNQYMYLFDSQEIFGENSSYNSSASSTRQLDYYSLNNTQENRIKKNSGTAIHWWTRSAYIDCNFDFRIVVDTGRLGEGYNAIEIIGVSPAFRIG